MIDYSVVEVYTNQRIQDEEINENVIVKKIKQIYSVKIYVLEQSVMEKVVLNYEQNVEIVFAKMKVEEICSITIDL